MSAFPWKLNLSDYEGSIFLKKAMREHARVEDINGFNASNTGIVYEGGPERYKVIAQIHKNENEQIKAYRKLWKPKGQYFETSYFLPKHGLGRVNPVGHTSLCIFHRPTRHSLCDDIYFDLDAQNCHPKICAEVARLNGIECPYLTDFAANHKKFRVGISNHFNISKEDSKSLPVRLLYGAMYAKWLKDHDKESIGNYEPVLGLCKELYDIRQLVLENNPEILAKVKQFDPTYFDDEKRSPDRTVMSLWCQSIERRIQETAIEFFVRETAGAELEDVVPCQDGFMVLRSLFAGGVFDQSLIARVEEEVFQTIGIRVPWDLKPFDEKLPNAIVPVSLPSDRDTTDLELAKLLISKGLLKDRAKRHFDSVGAALRVAFGDEGLRLWEILGKSVPDCIVASLKTSWPKVPEDPKVSFTTIKNWAKSENCKEFRKCEAEVEYGALQEAQFADSGFTSAPVAHHDVGGVSSDTEAAEKLVSLFPHWKVCEEVLYAFDEETGMWTDSEAVHLQIARRFSDQLMERIQIKGEWVLSHKGWGNCTTKRKNLLFELAKVRSITDNDWLSKTSGSSLKKLLFSNGYYDGETQVFHPSAEGFDPNIVFHARVPEEYPSPDEIVAMQPEIEKIRKSFFGDVFSPAVAERVIWRYAMAIFGDKLKNMIVNIGQTNGGKSYIAKAFKYAFGGGYIGTFNSESLTYNKNSSLEEAQRMRTFLVKQFCRLLFGNELTMFRALDGSIVKKVAGGVDELEGRHHGKAEVTFETQSTIAMGMNDFPVVVPKDDAAVGRFEIVPHTKERVAEPEEGNPLQLKSDPNLLKEMQTKAFKQAFAQLMVQAYKTYVTTGLVPELPLEMQEARDDYVGVKNEVVEQFLEDFLLTNDPNDFLSCARMEEWRIEKKLIISDRKWSDDLLKYARKSGKDKVAGKQQKKVLGKNLRGWVGIKEIVVEHPFLGGVASVSRVPAVFRAEEHDSDDEHDSKRQRC